MRRLTAALAAALAVLALTGTTPAAATDPPAGPAAGEDPALPLTALLPPLPILTGGYQPSAATRCRGGEVACVDAVITEMRRRLDPLLARCDHDAAFALTYLRVTEAYRRAVADPGFFDDTPSVNHHAAVFAHAYFAATDTWHRGDTDQVPPAWQVALRAADAGRVSAVGNLLLGLGAHVNRDLPYVLATIGLRHPDGSSRKPDHDRVNTILREVTAPILSEIAARLDPAATTTNIEGTHLDEHTLSQLLALWREEAWRNAELLVAAPTPATRAVVTETIEATAVVKQETLLTATAYRPPVTGSGSRDAWCRTHG